MASIMKRGNAYSVRYTFMAKSVCPGNSRFLYAFKTFDYTS